jgi:hypothetical protein
VLANEQCVGSYPNAKCERVDGYPTDLGATGMMPKEFLFAQPIDVAASTTVKRIGLIARAASSRVRLAIYTDAAGAPDTWKASAILSTNTVAAGRNEFAINDPNAATSPVTLAPGRYWIMSVFEAPTNVAQGTAAVGVRYKSWVPWNTAFPATAPANTTPDSLVPVNLYIVGVP